MIGFRSRTTSKSSSADDNEEKQEDTMSTERDTPTGEIKTEDEDGRPKSSSLSLGRFSGGLSNLFTRKSVSNSVAKVEEIPRAPLPLDPEGFDDMIFEALAEYLEPETTAIQTDGKDMVAIALKIFMSYFQFVSIIKSLDLDLPADTSDMFEGQEAVSAVGPALLSLDCALGAYDMPATPLFYRNFFTYLMLPMVFVSFFGLIWYGQYMYRLYKPGHWLKENETWTDDKKAKLARHKGAGFLVSMIVSLFLVQPSLTKTTFSVYDCTELDKGSSWLQMSMDVDCNSKS